MNRLPTPFPLISTPSACRTELIWFRKINQLIEGCFSFMYFLSCFPGYLVPLGLSSSRFRRPRPSSSLLAAFAWFQSPPSGCSHPGCPFSYRASPPASTFLCGRNDSAFSSRPGMKISSFGSKILSCLMIHLGFPPYVSPSGRGSSGVKSFDPQLTSYPYGLSKLYSGRTNRDSPTAHPP